MAAVNRDPSLFGVQLRRLRIAAGLTQEMLAERSRVSIDAISALESGRRQKPHPQTVALLVKGLDAGVDARSRLEAAADSRRGPLAVGPKATLTAPVPDGHRSRSRIATRRLVAFVCSLVLVMIATQDARPREETAPLGIGLTATEAAAYVVPGDPDRYSLDHLPATGGSHAVVAQHLTARVPYRVVVAVHDLRQAGTSTFVEAVRLVVLAVAPAPRPLRVWETGNAFDYAHNPYLVRYEGQTPGSILEARSLAVIPDAHPQLQPGESDDLTLQVMSTQPVELRFQVQVIYRVASELELRRLTLRNSLQVTFSDDLDWQPYRLQAGHLVPS